MFEPLNNTTRNVSNYNSQDFFNRTIYSDAARLSSDTKTGSRENSNRPDNKSPSQPAPESLAKDLPGLHNVAVQYSTYEDTGKTMIKIVDKDNNEVIREIPTEADLERSKRLRMYAGQLFNTIA